MDLKSLGRGLENSKPMLRRATGCGLNFLLGFALAIPRVLMNCGPFGIGIVAQAGAGLEGGSCLLGAVLGYMVSGGIEWGVRYVATALLVFTVSFVFRPLKVYSAKWFMPLCTSAITAVTSFLNSYEYAETAPAVILMVSEVVLAGASCYFFADALSTAERRTETAELRHSASQMILAACLIMSFAGIKVMGVISVGVMLCMVIVMISSNRGGMFAGAAAGAALGLAMDMCIGGTPVYTMAMAFAGLLSGIFAKHGKLLFTLSYVISNTLAVIWTWSAGFTVNALFECFAGSVIFMLLPASAVAYMGSFIRQAPAGMGESGLRRWSASRMKLLSSAFADIYSSVKNTVESGSNDEDVARVFDRAAESVCSSCGGRSACWSRDCVDTYTVMNDATPAMLKRGRMEAGDLAERFRGKCRNLDAYVNAVNGELRGMMYRREFRSRLRENRSAAYAQYDDLASVINDAGTDLLTSARPDPLAERRLLRYLSSLDIEADASVFRDEHDRLRVVIESGRLGPLTRDSAWLDKLSSVLGVRLCSTDDRQDSDGALLLTEAEPLTVSVGIAAAKKKGEIMSGDRGTYFKTEQGVLCVILSDGMGSGQSAAKDSISAVRILERFLRAGVRPETAMKILNSAMLLKNGEDWGYTTVDLMCIDLFTGEACFYKYGAAPSYVKNGKAIRRVRCESLAAGMCAGEASPPDVVRMKLKPGSTAVILSDGVLPERDDVWLRSLLSGWDGLSTKTLAKETLQTAVKQYGCTDDMTVLAVLVDKRQ